MSGKDKAKAAGFMSRAADDVEGHAFRTRATDDGSEDVEGHQKRRVVEDEDDVEGHAFTRFGSGKSRGE